MLSYLHSQFAETAESVAAAFDRTAWDRLRFRTRDRIAVIDDEDAMASLTCDLLERWGYATTSYSSAGSFLKAFEAAPERNSLIIADVVMPEMSGLQLTRTLRERDHEIPILLMTGFDVQSRIQLGTGKGRICFLRKPFTSAQLAQSVRRLLSVTG